MNTIISINWNHAWMAIFFSTAVALLVAFVAASFQLSDEIRLKKQVNK